MADINLAQILDIGKLADYKVHLAVKNKAGEQPLDVYTDDNAGPGNVGDKWTGWQEHNTGENRWSRQYILSFMQVYPEGRDIWLFGGIFEVLERPNKEKNCYTVKLTEQGREYIGRLEIIYHNKGPCVYRKLEKLYSELKVRELLRTHYSSIPFSGYEDISLDFPQLASIIKADQKDWRIRLEKHKGIYVIFDKETGKKYVGSAYGNQGIWSRWHRYVYSLHGDNKELKALFKEKKGQSKMLEIFKRKDSLDYAKKNFKFTLIECWPFKTDDSAIIHRENFWKEALLSRGDYGYNAN